MVRYMRLIFVGLACAYFWYYAKTYTEWHFLDYVNLIFHEAGHTIFFLLPTFGSVLMGSVFQILIPLSISLYFLFTNQKISSTLCLLWLGQNFLNVSVYAGDAVAQVLPLLGGDFVMHDWNYLLSSLGILSHTDIVAGTLYWLGLTLILVGTVLTLYFTWIDKRDYSHS